MSFLDDMPLFVILIFCLTLGLAPFSPPHVFEKIGMLFDGTLTAPMDMFDLVLHAAPWGLLILKGVRLATLPKGRE